MTKSRAEEHAGITTANLLELEWLADVMSITIRSGFFRLRYMCGNAAFDSEVPNTSMGIQEMLKELGTTAASCRNALNWYEAACLSVYVRRAYLEQPPCS